MYQVYIINLYTVMVVFAVTQLPIVSPKNVSCSSELQLIYTFSL